MISSLQGYPPLRCCNHDVVTHSAVQVFLTVCHNILSTRPHGPECHVQNQPTKLNALPLLANTRASHKFLVHFALSALQGTCCTSTVHAEGDHKGRPFFRHSPATCGVWNGTLASETILQSRKPHTYLSVPAEQGTLDGSDRYDKGTVHRHERNLELATDATRDGCVTLINQAGG